MYMNMYTSGNSQFLNCNFYFKVTCTFMFLRCVHTFDIINVKEVDSASGYLNLQQADIHVYMNDICFTTSRSAGWILLINWKSHQIISEGWGLSSFFDWHFMHHIHDTSQRYGGRHHPLVTDWSSHMWQERKSVRAGLHLVAAALSERESWVIMLCEHNETACDQVSTYDVCNF